MAIVEASPDNAGGGSAPSAALSALRTEPPPCVPGMRLMYVHLSYDIDLSTCSGSSQVSAESSVPALE